MLPPKSLSVSTPALTTPDACATTSRVTRLTRAIGDLPPIEPRFEAADLLLERERFDEPRRRADGFFRRLDAVPRFALADAERARLGDVPRRFDPPRRDDDRPARDAPRLRERPPFETPPRAALGFIPDRPDLFRADDFFLAAIAVSPGAERLTDESKIQAQIIEHALLRELSRIQLRPRSFSRVRPAKDRQQNLFWIIGSGYRVDTVSHENRRYVLAISSVTVAKTAGPRASEFPEP